MVSSSKRNRSSRGRLRLSSRIKDSMDSCPNTIPANLHIGTTGYSLRPFLRIRLRAAMISASGSESTTSRRRLRSDNLSTCCQLKGRLKAISVSCLSSGVSFSTQITRNLPLGWNLRFLTEIRGFYLNYGVKSFYPLLKPLTRLTISCYANASRCKTAGTVYFL